MQFCTNCSLVKACHRAIVSSSSLPSGPERKPWTSVSDRGGISLSPDATSATVKTPISRMAAANKLARRFLRNCFNLICYTFHSIPMDNPRRHLSHIRSAMRGVLQILPNHLPIRTSPHGSDCRERLAQHICCSWRSHVVHRDYQRMTNCPLSGAQEPSLADGNRRDRGSCRRRPGALIASRAAGHRPSVQDRLPRRRDPPGDRRSGRGPACRRAPTTGRARHRRGTRRAARSAGAGRPSRRRSRLRNHGRRLRSPAHPPERVEPARRTRGR